MKNRRRWLIWAVVTSAAVVVLVWVSTGSRRRAAETAEQEPIVSPVTVSHTPGGLVVVELSAAEQAKAGLETETLKASTRPAELTAYGAILDPAPLITLNAQINSARAALKASQAEFERTNILHTRGQNLSLKDLQTAESKFRADEAQFDQLNQQLADEWGQNIGTMMPDKRGQLLSALVRRTLALVRVSVPPGQSLSTRPSEARIAVLGFENEPLTTRRVSLAPSVDPTLQGQSFLLEVEAQRFPLRPGVAVTSQLEVPAPPQTGVVLPESAVVRTEDRTWVYVQSAPMRFERRPAALTQSTLRGWFVTIGLSTGDRVVVTGAQALLSRELQSQVQAED
jgi:hypothetical protein